MNKLKNLTKKKFMFFFFIAFEEIIERVKIAHSIKIELRMNELKDFIFMMISKSHLS